MKFLRNSFLNIFAVFMLVILAMNVGWLIWRTAKDFGTIAVSDVVIAILYLLTVCSVVLYIQKTKNLDGTRGRLVLAALIAAGFVIRLVYALYVNTQPISDYATMECGARSAANGDFSPFGEDTYFHRFPHITAFTLACGGLFKLFGSDIFVVKMTSIVLSCVCIFIMYLIGKKISDKRLGLTAASIYTFFIPSIAYCSVFASENFAMPFLMLSLYFVIDAYKSETLKKTIIGMTVGGMCLGIGCVLRNVTPFYLCAYGISVFTVFAKRRRLIPVISALLAFLAINQAVSLAFYHSGATTYKLDEGDVPYSMYMLVGANWETLGMFSAEDQSIYFESGNDKEKTAQAVKEKLVERVRENGIKNIPLMCVKTFTIFGDSQFGSVFWSYEDNGVEGEKPNLYGFYAIAALMHILILAAVFAGIYLTKDKLLYTVFALMVLGFEAGHMLMEVQARYTYSVAYVFVICAAIAICEIGAKGIRPSMGRIKTSLCRRGKKDEEIS